MVVGAVHWPAGDSSANRSVKVSSFCSIQLMTAPFGDAVSCGPMLVAPVASVPGVSDSSHGIGLGGAGASATGVGRGTPPGQENGHQKETVFPAWVGCGSHAAWSAAYQGRAASIPIGIVSCGCCGDGR